MQETERSVWRLSTPSALSSPAAGTYLMSCFTRRGAAGLAFWFSGKLKFSAVQGQSLLYCIQICLKCFFSLFCFHPSEAAYEHLRWIKRLLLMPLIGYFQSVQAFETLNEERIENTSTYWFFSSSSKIPPKGPETLQNCRLGTKHLELQHRPYIDNRGFRAQGDVGKSSKAWDKA